VEIAGMRNGNFSISLESRTVTIRGVRSDVSERRAYQQMEIPFGEFGTEVELTTPVTAEAVEATYGDGFLKVVLPKARPQRITVGNEGD
jgi:HSP20 family protein